MGKYFKDMDYEKTSEEIVFNGKRLNVKVEKYYNKRDNKRPEHKRVDSCLS